MNGVHCQTSAMMIAQNGSGDLTIHSSTTGFSVNQEMI